MKKNGPYNVNDLNQLDETRTSISFINTISILALVFAFFPFVSPINFGTDSQPLYFLFSFIWFLCVAFKGKIKFGIAGLILLIYSFWSLINIIGEYSVFDIRKYFLLLISFFSFIFALNNTEKIGQKFLFYVLLINVSIMLIQYLFPSVHFFITNNFLRIVKLSSIDYRGLSGLATEPGFNGALGTFYFATTIFLRNVLKDYRYFFVNLVLAISMIILTKSGTGIFAFFIFIFIYGCEINLKKIIIILFFISIFLIIFLIFIIYSIEINTDINLGRGFELLILVFKNPALVFLQDASVGHRILNLWIGIIAANEQMLGYGAGSYDEVSKFLYYGLGLGQVVVGDFGPVSELGRLMVEHGYLSILVLLIIFIFIPLYKASGGLKYGILALFFTFASFSLIFPPTWILLSMAYNSKKF